MRKLKNTLYDIKETILDHIYDVITDSELSEIAYGIVSMVSSFVGCGIGIWLFWLIAARTIVVGITTEIIFTPTEMRDLQGMIAGSVYHEIDSPFG